MKIKRTILFSMVIPLTVVTLGYRISQAEEILGVGTAALIGGDLTDPENDGLPDADEGYNAIFRASFEEGFGGGEFAFNVFDNILGPGNDKWCCGSEAPVIGDPIWVEAELPAPYFLTFFTVSSANDVPARDPSHWAVQGSNDGVNYDTIFEYEDDVPVWNDIRFQVIRFSAGDDFPEQETPYQIFRHVTYNTPSWPAGAYFQIGEIEFFGELEAVNPGDFNDDGTVDLADFEILTSNFNKSFAFDVAYSKGDMNRNGTVSLADFVDFRAVYKAANPAGAAAAAVPEPSTGLLLSFAGLVGLTFLRKRRTPA